MLESLESLERPVSTAHPERLPMRSLVIHAHFYQPPRENPYYDEVESEASAAPYHDWNSRIERECYRTVVAARVTDVQGRIERIVNTLEHISFNVGPTLFEWMERHAPDTYRAILAADRRSCDALAGHGNAIAHPYHHLILPLASRRDKVTEVRWGIADFRRRYGRDPEGMWLPETAVDDESLDVLAEHGIRFTVLAPHQVRPLPPLGHPGRYTTRNGRTIALFPYDGDMSHGIAFGDVLRDARVWASRIMETHARRASVPHPRRDQVHEGADDGSDDPVLVSAATDGETYGHHHPFSEMALARVLELSEANGVTVENYASWLARRPPRHEVELVEPSAWSCSHGVERWRSNCGCRMDQGVPPHQEWRTPLREGLDRLAAGIHEVFERDGAALFGDPWAVRDDFGEVDVADPEATHRFVVSRLPAGTSPEGVQRARELMDMEHDTLRIFTSCAWFFDDIGGLEPTQVLRYASRAIALSGERKALEPPLLATLRTARSSDAKVKNGAEVYRRVSLSTDAPTRVAAAAAALAELGLEPRDHLPSRAFVAALSGDEVTVTSVRTGGKWRFRARVAERRAEDLTCEVSRLGKGRARGATTVSLADFPEKARHAIRAELRNDLIATYLTADERLRLASGDASLRDLVGEALVRTIRGWGESPSPSPSDEQGSLVGRLLDLLQQLETSIPFDAQTAFWRLWRGTSPERRAELVRLKPRFGFAEGG